MVEDYVALARGGTFQVAYVSVCAHLSQLTSRLATGCPGAASQAITPSSKPTTLVPRHFAALSLNSRVLNNAYIATAIGLCLSILIPSKPRFSITPARVWWNQEMVSWLSQTEVKALVHGTVTQI